MIEQVRLHVHNLGKQGVAIDVVEELPMASGWTSVEPTHGGVWNEDTGEVTWAKVELPASGTWVTTVSVRITYPSSRVIWWDSELRQSKVRSPAKPNRA